MCICKEEKESETHILSGKCTAYGDLRNKTNIFDDKSLMLFFQEVLLRREELEEQRRQGSTCPRPGGEAIDTMVELVTPAVTSQLGGRNTQLVEHQ